MNTIRIPVSKFLRMSSPPLRHIEDSVKETTKHSLIIPPELIDEIIDYLWDNKDALFACSLVCQLFYIRTCVHLFNSIELNHTPMDEPSCQKFLPYIKKITIPQNFDNLNITDLTPFLSSLPNLTVLHLKTIQFFNPWSLHHLISQLRSLTSLNLSYVRFHEDVLDEPPIMSPDASFPKITKISMCRTSLHASVVEMLIRRRELRAIYVDFLRELCIKYPPGEYLSSICAFVHAASKSLKSFDLQISRLRFNIGTLSSWPAQPGLRPLTMPTLQIKMECRRSGWQTKVMTWLANSLRNGANGSIMLENLTLLFVPPRRYDGAIVNLEDLAVQFSMLDEILTGPVMKVFRRMKVLIEQHPDCLPSWEASHSIAWVHEKLQRVDERNMLEVDVIECTS